MTKNYEELSINQFSIGSKSVNLTLILSKKKIKTIFSLIQNLRISINIYQLLSFIYSYFELSWGWNCKSHVRELFYTHYSTQLVAVKKKRQNKILSFVTVWSREYIIVNALLTCRLRPTSDNFCLIDGKSKCAQSFSLRFWRGMPQNSFTFTFLIFFNMFSRSDESKY